MDLRQYFKKIREVQASISEEFPLLISKETSDGGKFGRMSETTRELAAKLIVEGRAALATEDQKLTYLAEQEVAKKAAEKAEMSRRIQVAIIADPESSTLSTVKKK